MSQVSRSKIKYGKLKEPCKLLISNNVEKHSVLFSLLWKDCLLKLQFPKSYLYEYMVMSLLLAKAYTTFVYKLPFFELLRKIEFFGVILLFLHHFSVE